MHCIRSNKNLKNSVVKLGILKKIIDLDRNNPDEQIQSMFYHSELVVNGIANDLNNGGEIKEKVTVAIYKDKGIVEDGNHRVAGAIRAGKDDDYDIPVKFNLLEKLTGVYLKKKDKFKDI
jgi:hypothetical protein